MMKKIFAGILLCALWAGTANAALVSRAGGQAYYDEDLNITWLANAGLAATNTFGVTGIGSDGAMGWTKQKEWIAAMNAANYLGANNWRLPATTQPDPTCSQQINPGGPYPLQGVGVGCTGSEMGHLLLVHDVVAGLFTSTAPFINVYPSYASGTEYEPDTTSIWAFDFGTNSRSQRFTGKNLALGAWPVLDGDIAAVPVPAAAWLIVPAVGVLAPRVKRRRTAA